jgi:TPR repeat protein
VPSGPATPAPAALAPVAPAAAATASGTAEPDTKALVARAERLIKLGDISGARLLLERAASRGNPQATYLLAQTCDPKMLRSWNVQGLKPDPDRARALYAKAAQDGISDAQSLAEAKR